ncbi:DUF305 domain-containing protein [Paracoccus sp. WLY502]|uniref:DUF305 domain-containing protein n=1 Tax=Paracoccus yibinensis TaxID=3068891 RepID=UPI0027967885|nr:DUF305 domain-containing protein [Paracoccus sp. WLY502]MDQ1901723.1 DUF305 domain-containing protein [Paracoccus sp. WLY502]
MSYSRFLGTIAVSTLVMFMMMYLNTWDISHVWFSQTRAWMALYMGGGMAIVMLVAMWSMFPGRGRNIAVLGVAALAFALGLFMVRSQATVDQVSWMRAMIPHHSIAILTSSRADIQDPRVRDLADQIIETQRREIAEMEALIADLQGGPAATAEVDGR